MVVSVVLGVRFALLLKVRIQEWQNYRSGQFFFFATHHILIYFSYNMTGAIEKFSKYKPEIPNC
jgi:hypothetical protein